MSFKTLSTALVLVLAAGAASAQGINAGTEQLARQAGVASGALTAAQLITLHEARRDNDTTTVNFILSQAGLNTSADAVSVSSTSTAGFTAIEQIQLDTARKDNDTTTVNYILSGTNRLSADSATNPGKAQIAAQLGVNAADYTTAELIALLPRTDS